MKVLLIAILCLLVILVGLSIYDFLNPVKYRVYESAFPPSLHDTEYQMIPYR
jgi:hypothetical protein